MSLQPRLFALLCTLPLVLPLVGCGDDGDATTASTEASTGSTGGGANTGTQTDPTTGEASTTGEGSTGGSTTGELKLGDILVTVTYEGMQTGTLSLAAVTSFPPMGPPLAAVTEKMPAFPFSGTLKGLEPRDYYVVAVLDVGDNNPQSPGPEDLLAFTPMPVTIVGDDMPMVSLTLVDP